jgi:hypothetical protein
MRADYKVKRTVKKATFFAVVAGGCGWQSQFRRQQKSMVCFICTCSRYPRLSGTDRGRFPGFLFASLLLGMFLIESHPVIPGRRSTDKSRNFSALCLQLGRYFKGQYREHHEVL